MLAAELVEASCLRSEKQITILQADDWVRSLLGWPQLF